MCLSQYSDTLDSGQSRSAIDRDPTPIRLAKRPRAVQYPRGMSQNDHSNEDPETYWDETAGMYQGETSISVDDFHYGPLLPGDSMLGLLPDPTGLRCLELGGGAGQNSIVLASRGGQCVSLDCSAAQQTHGRELAASAGAAIEWLHGDMDALPQDLGSFDLIHTNSLSFSSDPAGLIRDAHNRLTPGGHLLLASIHPLFQFEWLELDDEGEGLYVSDYFNPPDDVRPLDDQDTVIRSSSWPVSQVMNWLLEAGFKVLSVHEPAALPSSQAEQAPYRSDAWEPLRPQLERIPLMLIVKALREPDH